MSSSLRLTELGLLAIAGAAIAMGTALLAMVRGDGPNLLTFLPLLLVLGLAWAVHMWLVARGFRGDEVLLPLATLLTGLGLTIVWRLAPELLIRQVTWIVVGLGTMVLALALPRPVLWLRQYKYTWAFLGLGLVAATLLLGVDPSGTGARLWLGFGGIYFQPSELLKVVLVIFLAAYLEEKQELLARETHQVGALRLPPLAILGPLLVMWGLSVLLLVGQRDLGATIVFFGVFLAMLYVASSRTIYIWGGMSLFLMATYATYHLSSVVRDRVEIWLNPWADVQGKGYQLVQSLVALASGGVFGTGLGLGQPSTIPAVHTDFPFAAIAEEMGMAGALAVIALYLLLVHRAFVIALESREGFHQLMAAGLATVIALQSLVIIAGNIKLIPLTGITLPFISYGGSSLITNFLAVGLLLRISHENGGRQ